ncbi:hypothetical protein LOK49_LG11G01581 [Camellia lanceoleosa]|uniref:Uncharacterized protein n=1 Tax=Camellia lanceoleosa TaxID=1840588 RepID=A0ACC0FYU5_9ERIC|nr:hypothetical protein LOK49_LG11G01581 [Camellia lanceoleosa]
MKLASVNPRLEFNMDILLSKDVFQPNGSFPDQTYPLDSSASAFKRIYLVQGAHVAGRTGPASPTTLGKEIAIFAVRLSRERLDISQVEIMGKFAG